MLFASGVLLVCMLLSYTLPVQQEIIAENEVTPAPRLHLSEFVNKNIKKKLEADAQTCMDRKEESLISEMEQIVRTTIQTDIGPENGNNVIYKRKSQPICKYGVSEIFLFQSVADIQCQILNEDSTALVKEKLESTDDLIQKDEVISASEDKNKSDESVPTHDETETNMKLEVADIQSFEEWKNLKLQEKDSRMAETISTSTRTVRAKKTQVNYASQDCGAKVLAHNKEAKHISAILDENKDMYMLNPCSTSIWFVIELCEPIQVQQLQLGNLELFSSAPKDFSISISERYPAREWHTIGTFKATNERNLQTFTLKSDGLMFAKYIKFEMLSHFSNEHFCPLTLVRVLGISMVDEFDESEQSNLKEEIGDGGSVVETNHEMIAEEIVADVDGPINTVLNMVKSAMGLNNGADQHGQIKQINIKSNISEEEIHGNETETIDPTVESEVVLVTNETEIAGPPDQLSFNTSVQIGDGRDLAEYFGSFATSYPKTIPLGIPNFIQFISPISKKLNVNVCWFFEFFFKASFADCLVHYPYNLSAIGLFLPLSSFSFNFTSVLPMSDVDSENSISLESSKNLPSDSLPASDHEPSDAETGDMSFPGVNLVLNTSHDNEIAQSHALGEEQMMVEVNTTTSPEKIGTVDSYVVTPPHVASQDVRLLQIGANESDGKNEHVIAATIRPDNEAIVGSASKTEPMTKKDEPAYEVPSAESIKPKNLNIHLGENDAGNTMTDGQPEQPPVVINPGTNQKDSVFMRLSNRIRVLEQNMSLSSDYLENLSQRYKKQMDEMQRAFNQTTSKLLTTSRTANENDEKQTELIHQAQVEIYRLSKQLENLSLSQDRLHLKLVERHMCLITLEIIIFVAVLVTCVGRRLAQVRNDVERAEAVVQRLEGRLAEVQHTSIPLNGQCSSIPCHSVNPNHQSLPVVVATQGKRLKRKRSKQRKMAVEFKNSADRQYLALQVENAQNVQGQAGIEEVETKINGGNWTMGEESCNNDKRQNWNGNSLPLKIPNGHVKGRK